MRKGILYVLLATACVHPAPPEASTAPPAARIEVSVPSEPSPPLTKVESDDALELDERCLAKRVKLPVRFELNAITFLRPLCVVTTKGARRCRAHPDTVSGALPISRDGFKDGVAELALSWDVSAGEERLIARFERFDKAVSIDEARSLPQTRAIVIDCCSSPKVANGTLTLESLEGRVERASDSSPWVFEPNAPICESEHIAGDGRVVRRAELRGASPDVLKRSPANVRVTGTFVGAGSTASIDVSRIRYACATEEVPGWPPGWGVDLTGTGTCAQQISKVTTGPAPQLHTTAVDYFLLPKNGKWITVGSFKTYDGPMDPEESNRGMTAPIHVNDDALPVSIEHSHACRTTQCSVDVYRFDGTKLVRVSTKQAPSRSP